MATLNDITQAEIAGLVGFCQTMVVKHQEEADAAEALTLAQLGLRYVPQPQVQTRDWTQVQGYLDPATGAGVAALAAGWQRVDSPAGGSQAAVAPDAAVWLRDGPSQLWSSPGQPGRTAPPPGSAALTLPAGRAYVDAQGRRALVPATVWLDRATGAVAAADPTASSFTGVAAADPSALPPGLGALIGSPQEYVAARLILANGAPGLTTAAAAALAGAAASFELPGPWTDLRQPAFLTDASGVLVLDSTGAPALNPRRTVVVPFRGEVNDYYRGLVADHGVDPAVSRTAGPYEILKWGTGLTAPDGYAFASAHAESIRVYQAAFYNQALSGDALYPSYSRLFIAWLAILRAINGRMLGFGDVDLMNDYEVQNLLFSYGLFTFADLPKAYGRRLAKGVGRLLADKGTTQVLRDILDLFGFSNVQLQRHFLVKFFPNSATSATYPRAAAAGEAYQLRVGAVELQDATLAGLAAQVAAQPGILSAAVQPGGLGLTVQQDPGGPGVSLAELLLAGGGAEVGAVAPGPADYTRPDVGFVSVGMDDPRGESAAFSAAAESVADYDQFTAADPTWQTTRAEAQGLAFSALQTKYFSVEAAIDSVSNGIALTLLWSTLQNAEALGRGHAASVGDGGLAGVTSISFFEAVVSLLTLTLWKFGVDDLIPQGADAIRQIVAARTDGAAFPGEATLLPFSTVLDRVADFAVLPTADALVGVVEHNLGIRNALDAYGVGLATAPPSADEQTSAVPTAQALQAVQDFKFAAQSQYAAFGGAQTYSGWLAGTNAGLAAWVQAQDVDGTFDDAILSLVTLLEDAVQTQSFNFSFAFGTADIAATYVTRLIQFFKAYTTDLKAFNLAILIDRPATEGLHFLNFVARHAFFEAPDEALVFVDSERDTSALFVADEDPFLADLLWLLAAALRQQDSIPLSDRPAIAASDFLQVNGTGDASAGGAGLGGFGATGANGAANSSGGAGADGPRSAPAGPPAPGLRDTVALHSAWHRKDAAMIRVLGRAAYAGGGQGLDDLLSRLA